MKRGLIPGAVILVPLTLAAWQGQNNSTPPRAFDVASVKPNLSGGGNFSMGTSRGRLTATNVPVRMLVLKAFHAKEFQVSGEPGWFGTERYDIVAKIENAGISDDDLWLLLEPLMVDRFKLRFHRETKQLPVYSLVKAKGGPKFKVHTSTGDGKDEPNVSGRINGGEASFTALKTSMAKLADILGDHLDRTVVDNTGLRGTYDFKVEWAQDHRGEPIGPSIIGSLEESLGLSGPTIFTALEEQLGLKLESSKGPVEVIVIDGAEKAGGN
jgi:uncharacterized protein (TIGR03435 family)